MTTITIITVPSTDRAFRVHVDVAAAETRGLTPELLTSEVRRGYPDASVHVSSDLASLGEAPRWYVYRDRTLAREPRDAEWWRDESLPRTVIDARGIYLDANEAAAQLFGVLREKIVGAPSGSFTRHGDSEELARRLIGVLTEVGRLSSTAVVVRPDGEEIPIEFHTSRAGHSDGFITVMRPLAMAVPA